MEMKMITGLARLTLCSIMLCLIPLYINTQHSAAATRVNLEEPSTVISLEISNRGRDSVVSRSAREAVSAAQQRKYYTQQAAGTTKNGFGWPPRKFNAADRKCIFQSEPCESSYSNGCCTGMSCTDAYGGYCMGRPWQKCACVPKFYGHY